MPSIVMTDCECCEGGGGPECGCVWEWDGADWNFRADLSDCPMDPGRGGPGPCLNGYCLNFPPFEPGTFVGQLFSFACLIEGGGL